LPTADLVGDIEPLAMYAGQSSGIVDSVQPAAVIAQTLAADAQQGARPTRREEHLTTVRVVETPTLGGSTDRSSA